MRYYSKTHQGLVRGNNEDALLELPPSLFAVADGVGGVNGGEIASKMALSFFREEILRQLKQPQNPAYAMRRAVSYVNERLYLMAHSKPEYDGMGTTLTAVFFEDFLTVHVLQVGDSRLYLWRKGQLRKITEDQTYVGKLIANGKLTEIEGEQHPKRHWLLQAIGVENVVQAEVCRLELERGDKLLLCSDGLSNMLSTDELLQGLAGDTPEICTEWLLQRALQNGGKDNISLVVLDDFTGERNNGRGN